MRIEAVNLEEIIPECGHTTIEPILNRNHVQLIRNIAPEDGVGS